MFYLANSCQLRPEIKSLLLHSPSRARHYTEKVRQVSVAYQNHRLEDPHAKEVELEELHRRRWPAPGRKPATPARGLWPVLTAVSMPREAAVGCRRPGLACNWETETASQSLVCKWRVKTPVWQGW